jgi:surfactin synthase thioesterase subunit
MQIVDAMMRLFEEKPYALFGHSSGCWIAYEVCTRACASGELED